MRSIAYVLSILAVSATLSIKNVYAADERERYFFEEIARDRGNDRPRLAYAVWLDEKGRHDRAAFIRVQLKISQLERELQSRFNAAEWESLADLRGLERQLYLKPENLTYFKDGSRLIDLASIKRGFFYGPAALPPLGTIPGVYSSDGSYSPDGATLKHPGVGEFKVGIKDLAKIDVEFLDHVEKLILDLPDTVTLADAKGFKDKWIKFPYSNLHHLEIVGRFPHYQFAWELFSAPMFQNVRTFTYKPDNSKAGYDIKALNYTRVLPNLDELVVVGRVYDPELGDFLKEFKRPLKKLTVTLGGEGLFPSPRSDALKNLRQMSVDLGSGDGQSFWFHIGDWHKFNDLEQLTISSGPTERDKAMMAPDGMLTHLRVLNFDMRDKLPAAMRSGIEEVLYSSVSREHLVSLRTSEFAPPFFKNKKFSSLVELTLGSEEQLKFVLENLHDFPALRHLHVTQAGLTLKNYSVAREDLIVSTDVETIGNIKGWECRLL